MMMRSCMLLVAAVLSAADQAYAFVGVPVAPAAATTRHGRALMSAEQSLDRRSFLAGSVAALAAGVFTLYAPAPAFADLEDLSAPTETAKVVSEEEQQARIRRKLAAQAEATGKSSSGRVSYQDSLDQERAKQKALKKDKEARRQSLCEELGRGC